MKWFRKYIETLWRLRFSSSLRFVFLPFFRTLVYHFTTTLVNFLFLQFLKGIISGDWWYIWSISFFSSDTWAKGSRSFSDQNLSVVIVVVVNFSHFQSSSPEPLGQFQLNLAQSINEWRGFKFVQMKGSAPFPRGDNYEKVKIHWRN